MTSNRYIVHCISKFYELNELMGSYLWKLSDKNVHVHADIVNLEGESIVQKLTSVNKLYQMFQHFCCQFFGVIVASKNEVSFKT